MMLRYGWYFSNQRKPCDEATGEVGSKKRRTFIFPFIYCIKRVKWVQKEFLTFGSAVLLAKRSQAVSSQPSVVAWQ